MDAEQLAQNVKRVADAMGVNPVQHAQAAYKRVRNLALLVVCGGMFAFGLGRSLPYAYIEYAKLKEAREVREAQEKRQ